MKKLIASFVAALLLVGSLAGCQTAGNGPEGTVSTDTHTVNPSVPGNPGGSGGSGNSGDSGGSGSSGGDVPVTLPEGMSGTDAAKLLLANERLNAALLKNSQNIFDTGADVFRNLAATATENLQKNRYVGGATVRPLAQTDRASGGYTATPAHAVLTALSTRTGSSYRLQPLSEQVPAGDGSYVEIDGNRYVWKSFSEYSNSYSYFENITGNVVANANQGADLIDRIKQNVRVVDTWVSMDEGAYYLHVEEDMELLLFRDHTPDPQDTACRRYRNEDGVNVYEVYVTNSIAESRMIYIPGRKCEFSIEFRSGSNHDVLAENTKGFWEVVDVGKMPTHYNVSCMVLKDDICYDAFYNPAPGEQFISMLKVISADKKTDILWYSQYPGSHAVSLDLRLSGFDGIDSIEYVDSTSDGSGIHEDSWQGITLYHPMMGDLTLRTVNGTVIHNGDVFLDGKVQVRAVRLTGVWGMEPDRGIYCPSLELLIESNDSREAIGILREFLDLVGLTCRRDMDYVQAGIDQAFLELSQFTQYHLWNESPITSHETLEQGFANRAVKFQAWRDEFEAVKDAEVILYNDREQMELNMYFSPVTASATATASAEGILITEMSLTATDMLLFVEEELYTVGFAWLGLDGTDGTLTVISPLEPPATTLYEGGDSCTVSTSAQIPWMPLWEGSYTLVAYISTVDGIRCTEYTPVSFGEILPFVRPAGNLEQNVQGTDSGALLYTLRFIPDVEVAVPHAETGVHSYWSMFYGLAEVAYLYGFVEEDALLESLNEDGTWTILTGDEAQLESGTYRLAYSIRNGDAVVNGSVFTSYEAPAEEPINPNAPDRPDDPVDPENPSEETQPAETV